MAAAQIVRGNEWDRDEELAEMMIPLFGKMYRNMNVVTYFFGDTWSRLDAVAMVKSHREGLARMDHKIPMDDLLEVTQAFSEQQYKNARLNLGQLTLKLRPVLLEASKLTPGERRASLRAAIAAMSKSVSLDNPMQTARDVVLYGFGRIGRLLARMLIAKRGSGVKLLLRAIVVRKKRVPDLKKRADLLMRDSVHGPFHGSVEINEEDNTIIANGNVIKLIYAQQPDEIDYTEYGINDAIIIDNTGIFRDEEALSRHLKSKGVAQVLLTAPGKGIPNVVAGVNDSEIKAFIPGVSPEDTPRIISAASCTTNAVVPVIQKMDQAFGLVGGHIETVHSFTNDQNLIDNFHPKARRGRAATLNMVLTETGSSKAVVKVLPHLTGKLTANAIRVPTPNVSMAILILNLEKATSKAEVNEIFHKMAISANLIGLTKSDEVVSSDMVGNTNAGVVDAQATIVDGNRCNLYVWYDNEYGYSCQVLRVLSQMAGIEFINYPPMEGQPLSS